MKKPMKKRAIMIVLLALVLVLAACTQDTSATTTPPATATPTADTTATPDPTATATPGPDPSAVIATDEPDPTLTASAIDYLPAANQIITQTFNVAGADPMKMEYLYAAFDGIEDPTYAVTRFVYDQPMFYTNYYLDDDGLWGEFSDGEGEGKYLILPAEMQIGTQFLFRGEKSDVVMIDGSFDMGGYLAEGCLTIRTQSTAYPGQFVYTVYEEGYGEIAQYILYDEGIVDLMSVFHSSEDITDDEARQYVNDSFF